MPAKAKKADDADITFEDAAEKLEAIVEAMESEELPLEKLLVQYEEGTKLVRFVSPNCRLLRSGSRSSRKIWKGNWPRGR